MKALGPSLVIVVVALSICLPGVTLAQSSQQSYTVSLVWFTLQVTYPSEVMPDDIFNVTVQGTPTSSSVYLQNLTATIYYVDSSGLHQLATQVLVSNPTSSYGYYGYYGSVPTGSFSKSFTVSVPQDAPRTSLEALFSEATQYNNYPYNYGSYPFSYWYFGGPLYYSYYPYSQAASGSTDQAIAPLSYVKATTPEYVALQSQYRMLQQQLNQTQAQNQQLQQQLQALQNSNAQKDSTISNLNNQLSSAQETITLVEIVAVLLAIAVVALAVLHFKPERVTTAHAEPQSRTIEKPAPTQPQ